MSDSDSRAYTPARSYTLLFLCVFIWSLNYLSRQILLKEFSPYFLSALSLTVIGVVFLVWALATKAAVRVNRKEMLFLLLSALVGLIANQLFLYQGLKRTTATNASLLFTLAPLITAGLAALFLKERVTWRMIAGSLVAIAGISQALGLTGFQLHSGDWLMLGATFTFSCNLIFIRILSRRLAPFIVTVYSFALSSLLFDPFVLAYVPIEWKHSLWIWGLALGSILIAQGLTNVWWNQSMQTVGAAKAAIVLNLQPMMTMLLDLILFRHALSAGKVTGALLVFAGVMLGTWNRGSGKRKL
ncbi:DMT family transporter [Paenibacillus aurantius]|uniref:DMT family transporter n=1 Tax=Paenibacillus aurantius TaxID=2918900 RepID=A0AA96RFQ1_9BACL|nr:DMT family transporter [Paenibacillus aurantius]WNQ12252.1 DMT family transporter [Paenibacillus aurantius]